MIPLSDTHTHGRFPIVTLILIAINIFVFYLELTAANTDGFILQYALTPALVNFLNFTTLVPFITSMFLHGGFLHIISNMWYLWIFGDNVEKRLGIFYLPFYLAGGIFAAFAQYIISPLSNIPMLGASGAVAAVLGAYLLLFGNHQVKTLIPIFGFLTVQTLPASLLLILWFVMQLFSGAAAITQYAVEGGVAWFAHIGGFVFGFLAALPFKKGTKKVYEGEIVN
jgi:membrane associated rhomboid family serine protease